MKTKTRKLEREINEWVTSLWYEFQKSKEEREQVLATFDEGAVYCQNRPKAAQFFQDLKTSFLAAEKGGLIK